MEIRKRAEWLNQPKTCDICKSPNVTFQNNKVLYKKSIGNWPYIWICRSCGSAIGCHFGTKYPLGKMADLKTRQARAKAHKWFDQLHQQSGLTTRTGAYTWLANAMGLSRAKCHIGHFTSEQCEEVIRLSKKKLKQGKPRKERMTHIRGRKVVKPGERRKHK